MPAAISDRSKRRAPSSISCMEDQQIHQSPPICPNFSKTGETTASLESPAKQNSCDKHSTNGFLCLFPRFLPTPPQVLVVSVHGRPKQQEEIASTEATLQSTIESSPSAPALLNPCGHTYLGLEDQKMGKNPM